jgi:hypothetical protein
MPVYDQYLRRRHGQRDELGGGGGPAGRRGALADGRFRRPAGLPQFLGQLGRLRPGDIGSFVVSDSAGLEPACHHGRRHRERERGRSGGRIDHVASDRHRQPRTDRLRGRHDHLVFRIDACACHRRQRRLRASGRLRRDAGFADPSSVEQQFERWRKQQQQLERGRRRWRRWIARMGDRDVARRSRRVLGSPETLFSPLQLTCVALYSRRTLLTGQGPRYN